MTHSLFHTLTTIGLGGLLSMSLFVSPGVAEAPVESGKTPRQGLPGRRIGGGTREGDLSAYAEHKPLVALMPQSNLSITTAAYPTLLFHLPVFESEQQVEFVLYNSANEMVYDATFNVVGQSGITDIALSEAENLEPLVIDETYKWYFLIVADDRSQDIAVDGWIQRVDLEAWGQQQYLGADFSSRLNAATPLQQASMLGQEAGLWTDAALVLHQLRQTNPENMEVTAEWGQLLQSMGFSHMSEEPIAELSPIHIASE